jgi:hypothetical protein
MKAIRNVVLVGLGLMLAAPARGAPQLYWCSPAALSGIGQDIKDMYGSYIPTTSDWAVQILRQSDDSVVLTAGAGRWSSMEVDGVFWNDPVAADPSWNGLAVYTRLYNNANPALATMWMNMSPFTIAWSDIPLPATEITYVINQQEAVIFRYLSVASQRGMSVPIPGNHRHLQGTVVNLSVTSTPITVGSTQWVCTGWTGQGDVPASGTMTSVAAFNLTQDSAISWVWRTDYRLTLSGTTNGELATAAAWVPEGTNFVVEAMAAPYYHLDSWVGDTNDCVMASNGLTGTMDAPRTISAIFAPNITSTGVPELWLARFGLTNPLPEAASLLDADLDGMPNWKEWHCDTDPTNAQSVLKLLGIRPVPGGIGVQWQGGTGVAQYIEYRLGLSTNDSPWMRAFTNVAPTLITNEIIHNSPTNGVYFYRINVPR